MALFCPEWQKELMSGLKSVKPRYIIVKNEKDYFDLMLAQYPIIKRRELIRSFIQKNYHCEATFGHINIYKKNEDTN